MRFATFTHQDVLRALECTQQCCDEGTAGWALRELLRHVQSECHDGLTPAQVLVSKGNNWAADIGVVVERCGFRTRTTYGRGSRFTWCGLRNLLDECLWTQPGTNSEQSRASPPVWWPSEWTENVESL